MAFFRKSAAVMMIAGAGLASTTGLAFADDDSNVTNDSAKFIDASDSNNLSGNAFLCDIEAVQLVSVEDVNPATDLSLLDRQGDGNTDAQIPGSSSCDAGATNKSLDDTDNSAS